MPTTIVDLVARDIRFPTSRTLAGSDATNKAPDYSAAYVILKTNHPDGLEGHGMTFTIGEGNDICVLAEKAFCHLVVGHTLESFTENMGVFWHHITSASQLRWLGSEICQIDACRLGGVNEVLAVLLMAAKFGLPVCPHGGGVGLPEYVQHLSIFDYICVSGTLEGRFIEYVEHLHEHFLDPVTIKNGHYMPPTKPGFSIQMKCEFLDEYEYPTGKAWQQS